MTKVKAIERHAKARKKEVKTAKVFISKNGRPPFPQELQKLLGYSNLYVLLMNHGWGHTGRSAVDNFYTEIGYRRPYERPPNRLRKGNTPGTRIMRLRRERGLSLQDLEGRIGLNYVTIARHERDTQGISADSLRKYAKFYRITQKWILTGR